jgi:hypothetical protein
MVIKHTCESQIKVSNIYIVIPHQIGQAFNINGFSKLNIKIHHTCCEWDTEKYELKYVGLWQMPNRKEKKSAHDPDVISNNIDYKCQIWRTDFPDSYIVGGEKITIDLFNSTKQLKTFYLFYKTEIHPLEWDPKMKALTIREGSIDFFHCVCPLVET